LQAAEHFSGRDVRQEAEPASVDAQKRHINVASQFRSLEHGAVSTNGDDQIGFTGEVRLLDRPHAECSRNARACDHGDAGICQMAGQGRHRFGDAFVLVSAYESDGIEWLSHALVDYILPGDVSYRLAGWEQLIVANAGPAAKPSAQDNLDIYAMSCQRNFCVYRES
jgi:hypothetical protein